MTPQETYPRKRRERRLMRNHKKLRRLEKTYRPGGRVILLFLMVLLLPQCSSIMPGNPVYAEAVYPDVADSHWAASYIERLTERGWLSGYPDGTFRPENPLTYGEFIKMLVLAQGGKDPGQSFPPESHWALPYYLKGEVLGYIHEGRISHKALPHPISRRDMMVMASKALAQGPIPGHQQLRETLWDIAPFDPDEYAMVLGLYRGIITGYPDGTFRPEGGLTRAEATAVVDRLVQAKKEDVQKVPEIPREESMFSLEDFIRNKEELPLLKDVKYVWIQEKDPYQYERMRNAWGTEGFRVFPKDPGRVVVLVQDHRVIRTSDALSTLYWVTGATPGSSLPAAEYIGYFTRTSDTMMLVPYPF